MADAYIGEIRIFGGNFAPMGWALCNGQLLSIQQNTTLFAIIGVQYGGDGRTTFALPNLMGSAPVGQGAGLGLTPRTVGQTFGSPSVTLMEHTIPYHNHIPQAIATPSDLSAPTSNYWGETVASGRDKVQTNLYASSPNVAMSPVALSPDGGSQPHNNMQPYVAMNYIICLNGEFPSRP